MLFRSHDSGIEKKFAVSLQHPSIKLLVKMPDWFKIDTPTGTYNPDWAIAKEEMTPGGKPEIVYLMCETKAVSEREINQGLSDGRITLSEVNKIECGKKHFGELGVDFKVLKDTDEILLEKLA